MNVIQVSTHVIPLPCVNIHEFEEHLLLLIFSLTALPLQSRFPQFIYRDCSFVPVLGAIYLAVCSRVWCHVPD